MKSDTSEREGEEFHPFLHAPSAVAHVEVDGARSQELLCADDVPEEAVRQDCDLLIL